MIIGIGTNIVEVDRINHLMARYGQRFAAKVFTPREQEACLGAANQGQRAGNDLGQDTNILMYTFLKDGNISWEATR